MLYRELQIARTDSSTKAEERGMEGGASLND